MKECVPRLARRPRFDAERKMPSGTFRRGGRVVEGTGLENRQAGDRLVGSNPTPSANYLLNSCG